MRVKNLLRNKVVKNAGWLIGGKVMNKLLAFFVGILTARYLGPSNYGLINYAAAYMTFAASLCTLGINSVIIKNFADHPEEEGKTIGTAIILRAISSVLSALVIIGIVSIIDRDEPLTIIVVALYSIGTIFQVFDTLNYWFQSRLQSKFCAIATVISYIVVSIYKILLLYLGKSIEWFALANALEYIVVAVFLLIAYLKSGGPGFSFSIHKGKELLSSSSSFVISGLMVSIYACTDKLMLKQMLDEESVGYYALASSLSMMWTFVLSAIIDSFYPIIINSYGKSDKQFTKKNKQLYSIVFYSSVVMSLLISIFAEFIIEVLYGSEYHLAIQPLRIVVWYTAFSYLGVARNAWIVCEDKQKYLKYIYISAALLNVVLNVLFIPRFGASGAAVASLITQIATTMIFPMLIQPLRENAKMMIEAVVLRGIR